MDDELEAHLIHDYPTLYEFCRRPLDDVSDPTPSIALDGMACGDGWYHILDTLSAFLETTINDHPDRPTIRATQVKQKWGGLRMYTDPTPELAYGAITVMERLSHTICESCGTTRDVEHREDDGWRVALCPDCEPPTNY